MSVIVYGPQGCGKTVNAEKLRKFLDCDKVVDGDRNPYPRGDKQRCMFYSGKILFLTNEEPPAHCRNMSLIYHFDDLVKLGALK